MVGVLGRPVRDRPGSVVLRFTSVVLRGGALMAAVLLLAGCRATSVGADGADGSSGVSYSDGEAVAGSGHLTSRQLTLDGVTALDVGANYVVDVTIGEPEQAIVRMDDNLTHLVDVTVIGDRLRLGLKPGASVRDATLSAEVTLRRLGRITSSGVSEVTLVSEVGGERLELETGGTSRVSGPVNVTTLRAVTSGTSTTVLSGQAGRLHLRASGTSRAPLADLTVRDLDAALSGVSCATVAVRDTLSARTSGTATLRYLGTPQIIRSETSGVSSIAQDRAGGARCGA